MVMRLLCWNVNSLGPTVANAELKYGSWKGFFEEHALDILCLQVIIAFEQLLFLSHAAALFHMLPAIYFILIVHVPVFFKESKVPIDKLTKQLCCVEGYQVRPPYINLNTFPFHPAGFNYLK